MAGSITYNGINSLDLGVYVTGSAVYSAPRRSMESKTVPGKNGAIIIDQGNYNNIPVQYSAGIMKRVNVGTAEEPNYIPVPFDPTDATDLALFRSKLADIRKWLLSATDYVELTDTYNPDEYRKAVYSSGVEISSYYRMAAGVTLSFTARPERFLVSGKTKIDITASGTSITNPTGQPAKPILVVYPASSSFSYCEIRLNDSSKTTADIAIAQNTFSNIRFDSDLEIAYNYNASEGARNANNYITIDDYPVLEAGNTTFYFDTTLISKIEVYPNWWRL